MRQELDGINDSLSQKVNGIDGTIQAITLPFTAPCDGFIHLFEEDGYVTLNLLNPSNEVVLGSFVSVYGVSRNTASAPIKKGYTVNLFAHGSVGSAFSYAVHFIPFGYN